VNPAVRNPVQVIVSKTYHLQYPSHSPTYLKIGLKGLEGGKKHCLWTIPHAEPDIFKNRLKGQKETPQRGQDALIAIGLLL
jgi:hypothetical protein